VRGPDGVLRSLLSERLEQNVMGAITTHVLIRSHASIDHVQTVTKAGS
jgi:hypothetical protein